jgi:hypothetical protein
MFVLGWAVGKRSTPLDDWFHRFRHSPTRWLLLLADPWLLAIALAAGVAVALYAQRWRLAAVMVASPLAAILFANLLKHVFGRKSGGALAYPSGHTTAVVVVAGMIVLVTGAYMWSLLLAVGVTLLGVIGQAVTYHYFTDTVGALLLGTAVVCLSALIVKLDRRQPGCDTDHTRG